MIKLPRDTVSLCFEGRRCQCPLYFSCPIEHPCKLRDDYVKQWPLEIVNDDHEIKYYSRLFAKVYKHYRDCAS
jgi:hypothetical protein